MEVCDASEKQARTLQPAGQPVGHLQAGRLQAGGGLRENSSTLEDMIQLQAKKQFISIICQKFKKCDQSLTSQYDREVRNTGKLPSSMKYTSLCDLELKVCSIPEHEGCKVKQRAGNAGEKSSTWSFLLAGPLSKITLPP